MRPTPSTLAQSKERKGSNFAIWQPWRQESPAKFCAAASAFFLALACVGSGVTALGLAYFVAVGSLVLPGVARLLLQYPAVQGPDSVENNFSWLENWLEFWVEISYTEKIV